MRSRLGLVIAAALAIGLGFAVQNSIRRERPHEAREQPGAAAPLPDTIPPQSSTTTPAPVPAGPPGNIEGQRAASATTSPPGPLPTPPVAPHAILPQSPRLAARPSTPQSPDEAALENDLLQVQLTIRHFRDAVGENPTGTNAEIMSALLGDNLKQAKIGPPDKQQINDKGELIDRWGTPYFFHQVSKTQMEIRSAGPDRTMWTGDDRQL